MEINIGNEIIVPIQFSKHELAWAIEDAVLVLEYLESIGEVVLGGDVLNENKEYTYDNWHYNPDDSYSIQTNSVRSIEHAIKYISDYVRKNGNNFYVVIVTESKQFCKI